VTFSDALAAVRRWLWAEWVFPQADSSATIEKVPQPLRDIIFSALAPAVYTASVELRTTAKTSISACFSGIPGGFGRGS